MDLSGAVTVTAIQRLPGQLQVTLVRTDSPGDGSLTLIFADQPLTLRQWTVVDAAAAGNPRHAVQRPDSAAVSIQQLFEQISPPRGQTGVNAGAA